MKALTLWQPWASLVAIWAKRNETRGWWTPYRGPLAIHAGKAFKTAARDLAATEPYWSALRAARINGHGLHEHNLPLGAVVAVVRLVAVREAFVTRDGVIGLGGDPKALHPHMRSAELGLVTGNERAFGDYRPGRFVWVLEDTVALEAPIPARGGQGLWVWTPPVESPVLVRAMDDIIQATERILGRELVGGVVPPLPPHGGRR